MRLTFRYFNKEAWMLSLFKEPIWYCVVRWLDDIVAHKRESFLKSLLSLLHTEPWTHTHTSTQNRRQQQDKQHIFQAGLNTPIKVRFLLAEAPGIWMLVLSSIELLPETQSGDRGPDFRLGQACSWRSTLCYLLLTFPSVVEVINKLHKGGRNWIPGLQQSIVHASVSWWMPWFLLCELLQLNSSLLCTEYFVYLSCRKSQRFLTRLFLKIPQVMIFEGRFVFQ